MKGKGSFLRLIRFELRKNFLSPMMLVLVAVLLLLNGWKLQEEYREKTKEFAQDQEVYTAFYHKWKGSITQEHVNELMSIAGPLEEKFQLGQINYLPSQNTYTESEWTDYRFFSSQFVTEMKYDYLYQNEAIHIVDQAKELAAFYEALGNRYEVSKNQAIVSAYWGRTIQQFADTQWVEVWLNHDYSAMLILLLSLFGLCTVFVTERETQMYMLLRTTKFGSSATVAAKMLASLFFVVVICILFFTEDFLVLQLMSGRWEALRSPVYAIRYLETTPLTMTIGSFILWCGVIKTAGVSVMGLAMLLISCLCRRVLATFISGFGTMMALIVMQEFCRTRMEMKWFNPMELIMVRELVTETTFVNVFDRAVHTYIVVLVGLLFTGIVLYIGILRTNPGRAERRTYRVST